MNTERVARIVKEAKTAIVRNRQRAQRLVAQVERWGGDHQRRFHELGQALAALKAPALYRALGHASFAALLRKRGLGSPGRAAKLIRIAQELPAARARALGFAAAHQLAAKRHPLGLRLRPPLPLAGEGGGEGPSLGNNTARAALGRLERRMQARLRDGERSSWDVGMLFDSIARGSHHHAAGHETLEGYADARFPEHGYRTLARYRRVALAFTRATTIRHGALKLELGLRYIDATPAHERPAEIPRLRIAVPGLGPVAFARVTVRQLEAAIGSMTRAPEKVARLPRGAGSAVRALSRSIAGGAAWVHGAPRVTTRVAKDDEGRMRALVTIHDVAAEELARLGRALAASAGSV